MRGPPSGAIVSHRTAAVPVGGTHRYRADTRSSTDPVSRRPLRPPPSIASPDGRPRHAGHPAAGGRGEPPAGGGATTGPRPRAALQTWSVGAGPDRVVVTAVCSLSTNPSTMEGERSAGSGADGSSTHSSR